MRHFLTILAALLLCCAPLYAQTLKSLMFNSTNGQVVANTGTNTLTFTNAVRFSNGELTISGQQISGTANSLSFEDGNFVGNLYMDGAILFANATNSSDTRANLGFSTNLNTLWTATNASNARSAVGLGWSALTNTNASTSLLGVTTNGSVVVNTGTNVPSFTNVLALRGAFVGREIGGYAVTGNHAFQVVQTNAGTTMAIAGGSSLIEFWDNNYTNTLPEFAGAIGLARPGFPASNNVVISTFASENGWVEKIRIPNNTEDPIRFFAPLGGLTNNGNITINQTTPTNGLLFVYRTNNEPFLGIANLIASNNTTLSNETLFRVGRAEATNQAAQFGFRIVRTNNGGEGFATFSVFGYNALLMVGPSDRSRTNTNAGAAIEADIYTMTGTNRVMTLRDTNTGALTLHQDLGFGSGLTNNAPTNTNTPAVWLRVWVGTNNYRLPLYQ